MTVRDLRDWITSEKRRIEWFEEEAKGKHSRVENVTTRYQRPASELAKERRARAIAQARNEALRQIVAKVRAWDVRAAAVTLADRTRFEGQKVCCRILGLVDEKKRPAYFDYRKALRNHIEHADAAGVQRAIAALSLVPEDGFTQSGYGTWGGKENLAQLYAAGKKVGVDVPKLERELAAEKSKRLRTSAKSKSARRAA